MGNSWFAALHRPGYGRTAAFHLKRNDFVAWLPVYHELRIENGRKINKELALFPGYIFIQDDIALERWGRINRTIGVLKLLPTRDVLPLALPAGFVEDLQWQAGMGTLDAIRAECVVHKFVPEEMVKAKSGPWIGHTGEFVRYHKGSLVLLMALLGKEVEVGFAPQEVEPVLRSRDDEPAPERYKNKNTGHYASQSWRRKTSNGRVAALA